MKKLNPTAFRTLFFKHVCRFITRILSAQEMKGNHAVSVSGGLDSMALLWFLKSLSKDGIIGPLRVIYVHHHTRSGQDADELLIKDFCSENKITLKVIHVHGLRGDDSNFESKARKVRRELCLKELLKGELLWQGHHLDDSYEWNFMQRSRSTSAKSSLGIPVRNQVIVRPFLCVTRGQIEKLAKFEGIPFRNDPTNLDLKHDRNYLRHKIIPLIKKKYPKYLKFYSHFANFSAMTLNISIFKSESSKLFVFGQGAVILGKSYSATQIQEIIHHFSSSCRGEVMTPIERMLRAIENGKKGPFQFSGGVEAYSSYGLLMVYRQKSKNFDETSARMISELTPMQLQGVAFVKINELENAWHKLLNSNDAMSNMPGLMLVLESDSICKTLNTSVFDPLYPRVSAICKEMGFRFITIQKCLDVWLQKKERLPESLRFVPLYKLSNLFPSQE